MKRLLFAYNDSESSQIALRELTRLELPAQLDVMVLSVADTWMPVDGSLEIENEENLPENIRKARARARAVIEAHGHLAAEAASKLQEAFPSWHIEAVAAAGPPDAIIVSKSRDWKADQIVVGSPRHGLLRRFLRGSIAETVARNAACPVHVVRSDDAPSGDRVRSSACVDSLSH